MKISDRDFQKLLKNELLASANKSTLAYVLDACGAECLNFCDEELLHSPEKQGGQIGILLAGSATVTTPGESHNTLLRFLHEGDMFGIANLFSDTPYVSVIRTSGNGRVCWIPEQAFRRRPRLFVSVSRIPFGTDPISQSKDWLFERRKCRAKAGSLSRLPWQRDRTARRLDLCPFRAFGRRTSLALPRL